MKRVAYFKTKEVMDNYKVPILIGLRRTGKTTILKQIKSEEPNKSIIMRFDSLEIRSLKILQIKQLVETYIAEGTKIFLFDEIQVRQGWDILVKDLYDQYIANRTIKLVITGSSSLAFENVDTGVDRTEKVLISTLDFDEYCQLANKEKSLETFESFLGKGPFPEYVNKDISFDFLKQKTLEPILNNDIPSQYNISGDNIVRLLFEIASLSNGEFNKNRSSKNTGISINQINTYLDILEKTQIIKRVYQVNILGQLGKYPRFKIYLNPHFHLWILNQKFSNLNPYFKGHIIEAYWLFASTQIDGYYKRFYYLKTKDNQEIDFVSLNVNKSPIFKTLHEFKYSDHPKLNSIFRTTSSLNKVVWYKGETKKEILIKYENIWEYKKEW